MKRLFILASAAIVAFASCSKTQVVYNEAPEEIGFRAVTGSMTKAEEVGTLADATTMGVYAYYNATSVLNTIKGDSYFENISFSKDVDYWTGDKYWPLQSTLDFIVYSPYQQSGVTVSDYTYTDNDATVTVKNHILNVPVDNTGVVDQTNAIDIANQTDYLYGSAYLDNSGEGYTKENVAAALKHALAKVTLYFEGSNVTLNSVEFVKPTLKATYSYNYSTSEITWSSKVPQSENVVLSAIQNRPLAAAVVDDPNTNEVETADAKTATAAIMVVPAEASDVIIYYTLPDDTALSTTLNLTENWISGTHYQYNITINAQEIKFDPTVTDWADPNPTLDDIEII